MRFMGFLYEGTVVLDAALCVGILDDAGKEIRCELQFAVFPHTERDALGYGTGTHHGQGLGEDAFVHKDGVGAGFLHVAGTQGVHHRDGLGGGSTFVQQRAVGQGHARKVADNGLEVHQGFQAALRHLCLVGRVGGVPHGVLEDVALDDGRGDGVIPTLSDVRGVELVFGGQFADVAGKLVLVHGFGQVEWSLQAYVGGKGLVDEFIKGVYSDFLEHAGFVGFINADVAFVKRMIIHIKRDFRLFKRDICYDVLNF